MSQNELRIIRKHVAVLIRLAQIFCHGRNRAVLGLNEVVSTHFLTGALANSDCKATFPDRSPITHIFSLFGFNEVLVEAARPGKLDAMRVCKACSWF